MGERKVEGLTEVGNEQNSEVTFLVKAEVKRENSLTDALGMLSMLFKFNIFRTVRKY